MTLNLLLSDPLAAAVGKFGKTKWDGYLDTPHNLSIEKKKFSFFHQANMHTLCMHVQFKNIKRSLPAIEHIKPTFPLRLPHHPGIIIPGHINNADLNTD